MRLQTIVTEYVRFKRSLGFKFYSNAHPLRAFCRAMGDIDIGAVRPAAARDFIVGRRVATSYCRRKFAILRTFYRYAVARRFVKRSPLPMNAPAVRTQFSPYIYSTEELRRMIAATDMLHSPKSRLQARTMRMLLLLLYGTGLRIGEALALNLKDVDLVERLLTVRDTKFFKSRLVAIGPVLAEKLGQYLRERKMLPLPRGFQSSVFATRNGNRLAYNSALKLFHRVRRAAIVKRESSAQHQPRLHDIRHTHATHRLVAWYRTGADVQTLLPLLSTALGHKDLASTQRYLSMTTDLLQQAGKRFERYACQGEQHA